MNGSVVSGIVCGGNAVSPNGSPPVAAGGVFVFFILSFGFSIWGQSFSDLAKLFVSERGLWARFQIVTRLKFIEKFSVDWIHSHV